MTPRALWYTGPGQAELRPADPGTGTAGVRTLFTGLSRGTERLVFEGRVPESEWSRMRAPAQEGAFPFPVKYGYANVGSVIDGPAGLLGRTVFSLTPHQDHFRTDPARLTIVPDAVPPARATLAANMETALNAIWDAELAPGARVAVIGAGVVGCLTAYLAQHAARCAVTLVDPIEERGATAQRLGLHFASHIENRGDFKAEFGWVFHTSATAAGLAAGLDALGFEGTLVEMSWYGTDPVPVPLGGAFHSQRLRIIASQVGHVARARRATTSYAARLAAALGHLADPRLDALLTTEVAFEDLPARLPALLGRNAPGIASVVRYGADRGG